MLEYVGYEGREYTIVEFKEYEDFSPKRTSGNHYYINYDPYKNKLLSCTKTLLDTLTEVYDKSGIINKEINKVFNSFCEHLKREYWLYGIKIEKCDMDEILELINKQGIKTLWAKPDNESNILIVKEKDFMKVNNILIENNSIISKTKLKYVTKTADKYRKFLENSDVIAQIRIDNFNIFNIVAPMLLTNQIKFEIHTDKYTSRSIAFEKKDEDLVFNIIDKAEVLEKKQRAELICKNSISRIDKNYFINNLDYADKNNISLIESEFLYGHIDLSLYLSNMNFKLYYKDEMIGEHMPKLLINHTRGYYAGDDDPNDINLLTDKEKEEYND